MGKQLITFMTQSDSEKLVDTLQEVESFLIVHSRSQNDRPTIVSAATIRQDNGMWLYYFFVRNDDVSSIVMRKVPAQNYWMVDSLRSPVIEFTRSFFDGKRIRAGRLWYEKDYFGEKDEQLQKPQLFLAWADKVFKSCRQQLKKSGNHLIGFQALEMMLSGELRKID